MILTLAAVLSAVRAESPLSAPIAPSRSLADCVATAMQNNRQHPASRFAIAVAEAQHQQALSGYWPQVQLRGSYQRLDEAPNFLFPASGVAVPAQTITTGASLAMVTVPAGILGPEAVQLPVSVPPQSITSAAQVLPIPAQDVKLMNPDSLLGSVSLTWLVFDGGMRHGLRTQSGALVAAMKEEARRTDLEIVDAVHRMFYGAVLARELQSVGHDTLSRMEATLNLTEHLYQDGVGKVTKADYLDNKIMVESLRAIVATLDKNAAMAQAALANTMGLPWQASIAPDAREIPFEPISGDVDAWVATAYEFSPDWRRFEAALQAGEGAVETARSGHAPRVALTGDLHAWRNSYAAGMATAANKQGWTLGVGIELPLFDGFQVRGRVAEARARLDRLKEQKLLLREGIGLQIRDTFLSLVAARDAYQATLDARTAAVENRDLNVRAYQSELVETEKVIRAQLMEAFMTAQHLKVRYDHAALHSQLQLLVGTEIVRRLAPSP